MLSSFLTFSSLAVTCFGVIFYHLLCLDFSEFLGYVGCCFMLNLEKLWALFLHMSPRFSILPFFLLRSQLHIYETARYCPLSHRSSASFVIILLSLFFSLDNFFWPVFKFTDPLVFIVQIAAKGIWWLAKNFRYQTETSVPGLSFHSFHFSWNSPPFTYYIHFFGQKFKTYW